MGMAASSIARQFNTSFIQRHSSDCDPHAIACTENLLRLASKVESHTLVRSCGPAHRL